MSEDVISETSNQRRSRVFSGAKPDGWHKHC